MVIGWTLFPLGAVMIFGAVGVYGNRLWATLQGTPVRMHRVARLCFGLLCLGITFAVWGLLLIGISQME